MKKWMLNYKATCDFRPFRYWLIEAESVDEARQIVAGELKVPLEQVDASIASLVEPTNQFIYLPLNTELNTELPTKIAR
jgi:hypothetical protein